MEALKKPNRGQLQPGNPGGGRPLGSRNKLTEVALAALTTDFAAHGQEAIARVRREKPHHYLSVVASLLPRQVQKLESPFAELTDVEIDQLEQLLAAIRARTVRQLDQHNGADNQPDSSPALPQISETCK